MISPQAYLKYPENQASIETLDGPIEDGIYDKGLDEFDPDRIKIYLKYTPYRRNFPCRQFNKWRV